MIIAFLDSQDWSWNFSHPIWCSKVAPEDLLQRSNKRSLDSNRLNCRMQHEGSEGFISLRKLRRT